MAAGNKEEEQQKLRMRRVREAQWDARGQGRLLRQLVDLSLCRAILISIESDRSELSEKNINIELEEPTH